jgi:hypothetical protein
MDLQTGRVARPFIKLLGIRLRRADLGPPVEICERMLLRT